MTRRHAAAWLLGAMSLAAAAGSLGCSSESSTSAALTPAGPPALAIEEPLEGACTQLYEGDPLTARVRISTTNWSLRPPDVCGVYPQCGYAVMFVDDIRMLESASLVTDVPFGNLAEPAGQHMLRVELHNDDDSIALDADGAPLRAQRAVVTAMPGGACP